MPSGSVLLSQSSADNFHTTEGLAVVLRLFFRLSSSDSTQNFHPDASSANFLDLIGKQIT